MGKRGTRGFVGLVLAVVMSVGLLAPSAAVAADATAPTARAQATADVEPGLYDRLASGALDRFVVELRARADLAAARAQGGDPGQATYEALVRTARDSQAGVLATIRATPGAHATAYWIVNEVIVYGDADLARRLAARPDVARVRSTYTARVVEPVDSGPALATAVAAAVGDPEWGVDLIGADDVWAEGILGSGVVIANVDTGVDYTHPALVNQYRGNLGAGGFDHDYSWWDPTGICGDTPCDNAEHGTHTMGTMVGGDGPGPFTPDVGVAPGARWIAAKGCEDFSCSEEALVSSGQWIAAPTDTDGNNPDPSKRPDIVNNSWGDGPGNPFYQGVVDAWRSAGIIPVFSAGNDGPSCSSGGSPGDYLNVIAAGATDIDDQIADFSSRGPSSFGKVDPDIAAPGVDVTSSVPGGGYASFSGTSMAAPHTSGTIALLISAEPALAGDYDAIIDTLRGTAIDHLDDSCGGDADGDPNNVYGDGRIDALAAVDLVATGGTLGGLVDDDRTDLPVAGAQISVLRDGRVFSAVTDEAGRYSLFLAAGTYTVSATAFGYDDEVVGNVEVTTDRSTRVNLHLTQLPTRVVSGRASAVEDGTPIVGASVRALGTPVTPAVTRSDGSWRLVLPMGSTYTLLASAGGCTEPASRDVLVDGPVSGVDFALASKLDGFGHACRPIAFDWVDARRPTALTGNDFSGRLTLPFSFAFYTATYTSVYVSDNGYLTFGGADVFHPSPGGIPSSFAPNGAVYALWQDLRLDDESAIEYGSFGTAPNRVFVVEYDDVLPAGSTERLDFEVKLWEGGQIDVLYGDNAPDPGDGRDAGIGIEDPEGDDGLQVSLHESSVRPNSALRYEVVPTGVVTGRITDRNDGSAVPGASISVTPGNHSTVTGPNGKYALRLRPGQYRLVVGASGYTDARTTFSLPVDSYVTKSLTLAAPLAAVDPTELDVDVSFGQQATRSITLSDPGTAPLPFQVFERVLRDTHPTLPPAAAFRSAGNWTRTPLPAGQQVATVRALPPDALLTVVDDPAGDSTGQVDVDAIRAGSDTTDLSVAIDFTADTPMSVPGGYVMLDTDQNASTGLDPEDLAGSPGQDIGVDYFAELFSIHDPDPVVPIFDSSFNFVAAVPAVIDGQTVSFSVPLAALGDDDGTVDVVMNTGDFGPEDWAPDAGHGTIQSFSDAPWMSVDRTHGVVPAGASRSMEVTFGTADLQPGTYQGNLVLLTGAASSPVLLVDVRLHVRLPADFGELTGSLRDAHTFAVVSGTVTVHAQRGGQPLDVSARTPDGTFDMLLPNGVWPVDVVAEGYVPVSDVVSVTAGQATTYDVELHRDQPHATITGGPITATVEPGGRATARLTLGNADGHEPLRFTVGEAGGGSSAAAAGATGRATARSGPSGDPSARNARAYAGTSPAAAMSAPGGVIASWATEGVVLPWGVASPDDVFISDPELVVDARYTSGGAPLGQLDLPWAGEWAADMAWDAARNLIWQVNVGGDNGIYGIDPDTGDVEQVITGSPWSDISQRGVAYDPASDTFYVGGWNEGIVYHVAGPSAPTPGEVIGQCTPDDPNISGLAFNGAFGALWEATNSESDTLWLIDATTCEPTLSLPHPEPGFNGAGIELDSVGNLWTVSQSGGTAYLIDSGVPALVDVPWLSVRPDEGRVRTGETVPLRVDVDATGLAPGNYHALVVVQTDDPDNGAMTVPVDVLVTAYQQAVNVGGAAYLDTGGESWAADQAYRAGSFGYVGGDPLAVEVPIRDTEDDALYQDQREGLSAYRFDVPDGRYQVVLRFAELEDLAPFGRVFDVRLEDTVVATNLDIAGVAGDRRAYDLVVEATVTDGRLDITLKQKFGEPPILNAVSVRWVGA